jgi:phosphoglycerol transferase MdoB-like AlkP superfamily enzyme
VADHGSRHPRNHPIHHPDRFRIPMLWLGGALAVQDTVVSTYGTHTDIANTLLGQLGTHHAGFTFSRDMFRPASHEFGWYVFNNGYGVASPHGTYIYDLNGKISIREEGPASDTLATMGKALMQALFSDFNAK